jgi:hypothetical protein
MGFRSWSKSEVEYGRRILTSGLVGARSGREAFLHGESLTPFFGKAVRHALVPAVVGACVALIGSRSTNQQKPANRTLVFGLLGCAIGLGIGVAWESRGLTASVAGDALKNIDRVRDEHWFERHPIDYA